MPEAKPPLAGITFADLAALREVLLDVIDDGCTCNGNDKHGWEFNEGGNVIHDYPYTEAMVNESRQRFCDEVGKRIVERGKITTHLCQICGSECDCKDGFCLHDMTAECETLRNRE